ncbi:MAG TPA: lipopolysaccharide heptosyltransferase II [Candidatus Acidoferrum sp.]|nr:lipopolysaccharide heptosyltransferase II [Candidatus Acidoferrum sp.]
MKILIRATNWVGDAIMALPALRAVRSGFPEAEIAILARPYVADIYREQEICNQLIAYDSQAKHAGMVGRERLAAELQAQKFDVALLLQNAFDAAWLAWRSGIPERIGYARDGRGFLLTKPIRVPKTGEIPLHEKFYYLELLRRAGWIHALPEESFVPLNVSESARRRAEELLAQFGARAGSLRIAIAAGASYGSAKCWPPARFAELANRLQSESGAEVILFATAREAVVTRAIAAELDRPPVDLTEKTSIADLPALLSQCHLFIGNDSGAMHVAAGVGLAVVAVFGPTDPFGTAPMTPRCTIVQQKPYCSPCFLRHCPTDHRCMLAVTAEMAEAAARPWLSTLGAQRA